MPKSVASLSIARIQRQQMPTLLLAMLAVVASLAAWSLLAVGIVGGAV
jgi:hypothetical protein